MSLRDFYQTHYFHELERREQLNNSLTIPLGIISLVSGAFLVVAKEVDFPFDNSEIFQLIFLGLTAVTLVFAVIFLVKAYWGYGYGYMPKTEEIKTYSEQLNTYYKSLGKSDKTASNLADEETLEYLDAQYSFNSELNANNNDIKSKYLFTANGLTMASVVFLVIAATPYVVSTIVEPNEIQKIQLVNIKDIPMTNQKTQPPTQSQQSTPPPKPSPPPSRVIKEHVEPTTKK